MKMLWAGMKLPLKGVLYFKRPDRVSLKMDYLPKGLKNHKGIFRNIIPASFNPEDYEGKVILSEKLAGKIHCNVLELVPRGDSPVSRVYVWVDTNNHVSPKTKIYYKSGGVITTLINYRKESGYVLPHTQFVDLDFPDFNTRVRLNYKKYQINKPLPDKVFDDPGNLE